MALERKDVRFKLDADMHKALTVITDVDHLDIGDWVEQLVEMEIRRRVHEAQSIASEVSDLGITGKQREFTGMVRR